MAPVYRHERRQQRVRGAGPSSVQASFGFNFGALGAASVKQSSLPPQKSSHPTPRAKTPRSANGSAQRPRSVSSQRSSGTKRKRTPSSHNQTPQLGKRKRDSASAQPGVEEQELDELSLYREENAPLVEKSSKRPRTISPIQEELVNELDELSILEDSASTLQKFAVNALLAINGVPAPTTTKNRSSSGSTARKTPTPSKSPSRRSVPRSVNSTEAEPIAPVTPKSFLAASLGAELATPTTAPAVEDSEDELSPSHHNESTLHAEQPESIAQLEVDANVDGSLSPIQPMSLQIAPPITEAVTAKQGTKSQRHNVEPTSVALGKRGRPRQEIEANDESLAVPAAAPPPSKGIQRGRPRKATETRKQQAQITSIAHKPGSRMPEIVQGKEVVDELSPESGKTKPGPETPPNNEEEVPELSDAAESDEYQESEPKELDDPTRNPASKRDSPKQASRTKPSSELPARKRQKFTGPKQSFSVMRIKGSTVRGITVADTARTILEETINHRLTRMAEKVQTSQNSAQRKELRSCINLTLSFKESLDEKLLDLQDANDVLSTGFKKMKLFRRDNAGLRKEILALQNSRQDIALEHDDVQAEFDADKAKVEERNILSANLYDIEAAVRNGRRKAQIEGREDEGPEIPLGMMIDDVGRSVGSFGGGLLDHVKGFNGLLERAASWLEGRAQG